jgi:long-chain acyl-CoA synthetase
MYLKELTSTWEYIIKDSGINFLMVANMETYDKIMGIKDKCPSLKHVYVIETNDDKLSMAGLEKLGMANPIETKKPKPEDIACLIYTSGTTGDPKGVLLSHANLTSNIIGCYEMFWNKLDQQTRSFSILPWAHSYGFVAENGVVGMLIGGSIGLMHTLEEMLEDIPKVQPTYLVAVPRVFNKVYNGVLKLMDEKPGIIQKLFKSGLELAEIKRTTGKSSFKLKLVDKLIFAKVRAKFGGRLHSAVTSSAAMDPAIAKFMVYLGINCYDAYGATELSPAATANSPVHGVKLGSIGKAFPNTTVVIDKSRCDDGSDDGEILIYGPGVMQGYLNKPDKTAEVLLPKNETGYRGYRTGDRGRLDEDGFLWITGRFKEEYKLLNGKYVHPASIEESMKLIPWVANAFVYGDGKQYNVSLVYPDLEALPGYAEGLGINGDISTYSALMANKDAVKKLEDAITAKLTGAYGGYEIPRKFKFIKDDFTVDSGLLTQTLKLKRSKVEEVYKKDLNALY